MYWHLASMVQMVQRVDPVSMNTKRSQFGVAIRSRVRGSVTRSMSADCLRHPLTWQTRRQPAVTSLQLERARSGEEDDNRHECFMGE